MLSLITELPPLRQQQKDNFIDVLMRWSTNLEQAADGSRRLCSRQKLYPRLKVSCQQLNVSNSFAIPFWQCV